MRVAHLARKPISEGTVGKNVFVHGTGGINVDASRIGSTKATPNTTGTRNLADLDCGWGFKPYGKGPGSDPNSGRHPSNCILLHREGCRYIGTAQVKSSSVATGLTVTTARSWKNKSTLGINRTGYASSDGTETVDVWECVEGCPVEDLNRQSALGGMHGSGGGIDSEPSKASRFFKSFGG
jgi:hypothetical protein